MPKPKKISDKTQQISNSEMKLALSKSGYFLEQRAKKGFVSAGFSANTNTSFLDPYTSKSREIDLEASYLLPVFDNIGGNLFLKVVAECKNKLQPIVFIKSLSGLLSGSLEFEWRVKGNPTYFIDENGQSNPTIGILEEIMARHVYKEEKCTQWCTFKYNEKTESWVASGDEDDFLSLQTLMIATKQQAEEFQRVTKYEEFSLAIFQPVLILQNEFYIAHESSGGIEIHSSEKLALRCQFTPSLNGNPQRREIFMIDVISEKYLPTYLKELKEGMERMKLSLVPKKEGIEKELNRRKGK